MVVCKFFQQGNCRFGQYCKFVHSYGNRSKTFGDEKNIVLIVAEEVLAAERGGQWLLSCFGPFKERKCLPGMEDFSPEEVRWEMYQAQKNGTTDQINTQFQQMCEAMKVKREALKHPTPAIQQLLEEVQNSGSDNSAAFVDKNKGNSAFGQSQMSLANNTQSSNVFAQKSTFGAAPNTNPFGGSSTFNASQPASSIFAQSNNAANSVFGGKPSFGGSSVFGGSSSAGSSIFGGANKTAISPFSSVPNTQTFGGLATQGTNASIFGGAAPTTAFGLAPAFSSQANNAFLKPQTSQTSVFGGASSTSNVFGGSVTSTAPTNSAFSGATTAGAGNSSSIFGQKPANTSAFGGAPVFGGSAFGSTQNTGSSVFGGQTTFGSTAPSSSIFGSANVQTSTFGGIAQNAASSSAFGAASAPTGNAFEAAPNATPFGTSSSITAGPFGTASTPTAQVFATSASTAPVFGNTFSSGSTFGTQQAPATNSTTNVFGATTATSNTQSVFGGAAAASSTPSAFGGTASASNTQSVFGTNAFGTNTQTTAFGSTTTASSNPFMKASPFGTAQATQASPFGAFGKSNVGFAVTVTIDETGYTPDENLTDDEKAAYRESQFVEGFIPLRPPSKELC